MNKSSLSICILLLVKPLLAAFIGIDEIKYAAHVSDECKSHRQCKNVKYTQCNGGMCDCLPNYNKSLTQNVCEGRINAICDSDHDCQNQKEVGCIFNTCQSYTTFFTQSNAEKVKIYRANRIGSRCETNENCSDLRNTVCIAQKCNCANWYWKDDDVEICKPVTNATCTYDSDCKENGTKCFLDNCMLPNDFLIESNALNISFHTAKQLGDFCQTDHHCRNLNYSRCRDGACDCAHGSKRYLVKKLDSTVETENCRKVLNVFCDKDDDCKDFYGAKCFFNNCSTPEDFFIPSNIHNASLYAATSFRDVCRTDHHCRNIENTHCVDELCDCIVGYGYMSDKCHKLSDLFCTHDSDCQKYNQRARCLSNLCQYPNLYFQSVDFFDYKTPITEGYCVYGFHCTNLSRTHCHLGKCKCEYGYENQYNHCRRVIPINCTENHHCEGFGESCFFGLCQTLVEFFKSTSTETSDLYAADHVFGRCKSDHNCRNINNTSCLDGRCECKRDSDLIFNVTYICQRTVNVPCSDDSDCIRADTRCLFNICLYPSDFFNPSNGHKTGIYAAKRIYGPCRSDHHCRNLKSTYCFDETCNCLPGYEYVDGFCQKAINVTCLDDSDCLLPRTYCFLNTCLYPEDFLAPSNNYNISLYAAKSIDGFCQSNHHCRKIADSKCFRRKCIFKDQWVSNEKGYNHYTTLRI